MNNWEFTRKTFKGMINDFKFMFKYWDVFSKEERVLMERIKYYNVPNHVIQKYKHDKNRNYYESDKRCENKIKRACILAETVNKTIDDYIEVYRYGFLNIIVNHRTHEIEDILNHKSRWGKDFNVSEEKKELIIKFFNNEIGD